MTLQLLREWPPGYGGIERVAHELADVWGGMVFSLDAQPNYRTELDPLPVRYRRQTLPRLALGRLLIPWPSQTLWQLLKATEPLHGHLPSPGVLLILLLARLIRPQRQVTAHWHCFLESSSGFAGCLFDFYQRFALLVIPCLSSVVTTSPPLASKLELSGCPAGQVKILPCCLPAEQESAAMVLPPRQPTINDPLQVLFIGRLDSYKRLDWLLEALATLSTSWHLDVVGDGPRRASFAALATKLFGPRVPVTFHGRLDEVAKLRCLTIAEVLVLPSDRSNEAFGIVQLEAMAAGLPALAFDYPCSGMGWVGRLPGLIWSQRPEDLATVLQRLAASPTLRVKLGSQARARYDRLFARPVWHWRLSKLFPTLSS